MRRLILMALGLGILGAVGCHHVAGVCDCEGPGGCGCGEPAAALEGEPLPGEPIGPPIHAEPIKEAPRPLGNGAELK